MYRIKIYFNNPRNLLSSFFLYSSLFLLSFLHPVFSRASEDPIYEETSVFISLPKVGGKDIPALIKGDTAFLSITKTFEFLKINHTISEDLDTIKGFIISPGSEYLIDYVMKHVSYDSNLFELNSYELVQTSSDLYLRTDFFGKIFGIDCQFSYRNLSITIATKLDLPIFQSLRQNFLRANIGKLKAEIIADTIIGQRSSFFSLGAADWTLINSRESGNQSITRINTMLGANLAGGEASLLLKYDNLTPFTKQQHYYNWRYVNNNKKIVKQLDLGIISPQSSSTLYSRVNGIQLTNAPSRQRRMFGSYSISDQTEPGWIVELYINNTLIDYKIADASGYYSFEAPLIYGSTKMILKFYSPSGEVHSSEKSFYIPFSFLPSNSFEYKLSAGIVENGKNDIYSKIQFNYGLGKDITIGGGIEYLSSVKTGNKMPFATISLRPARNTMLNSEYINGVRSKTVLTYHLPSKIQIELNYIKYNKTQTAILNNNLEERKLTIFIPQLRSGPLLYPRLIISQNIAARIKNDSLLKVSYSDIPKVKTTRAELMFSATFSRMNINLSTFGLFRYSNFPSLFSNLSISYNLPNNLSLRTQYQFNYYQKSFVAAKLEVEKQFFKKGFASFSFERNFSMNCNIAQLGLRYEFSFLKTSFLATRNNKTNNYVQTASGSFLYNTHAREIISSNREQTGKGAILLAAFLDLNSNGQREKNEPGVNDLNFRISSGRLLPSKNDGIFRIKDIEPFINILIDVDANNFQNIAWRIKNKKINVVVQPNSFTLVEVPVEVLGEASGYVFFQDNSEVKGLKGIKVNILDSSSRRITTIVTEADGFFYFLGLSPGKYMACLDSLQLNKMKLSPTSHSQSFTLITNPEGPVYTDLKFELQHLYSQNSNIKKKYNPAKNRRNRNRVKAK